MAVTVSGSFAPTTVYTASLGINVASGTDCLLLFVQQFLGTPTVTATLGSSSFNTALDTSAYAYGGRSCRLLRLDNPASGTGTVTLTGSGIYGFCLLGVDGVDLTDLFTTLTSATYTDTTNDTFPVTVSSATDDLTFLFAGAGQSGGTLTGFTASDGATLAVSMTEDNVGVAAVYEAGATSVTLGVDPAFSSELHAGLIYGALRASGGAPAVTDYTMVYRRAQMAALMGD